LKLAPTEIKNIATNISLIGLESSFATSADFDSATSTPAKNAPIATDNPTTFANKAYPKHKPRTLNNKISRFSAAATLSMSGGITRVPIVNVPTINATATATTAIMDSIDTVPTRAIDCNEEIRITAIISSTIKIPKIRIDDSFLIRPVSSKSFTIIAVLEIDNAAEMNNASIKFNPSAIAV